MFKRLFSVCLVLLLAFGTTSVIFAKEKEKTIKLKPEKDNYVILDNVELTEFEDGYNLRIQGSVTEPGVLHYTISVDKDKQTYKTVIKEAKKDDKKDKEVEGQEEFSILSTNKFGRVTVTTQDPPQADLAETSLMLHWDGSTRLGGGATYWAANPSIFGTHWYLSSKEYYQGGTTSYFTEEVVARYYNYDWRWNDQITWANHRIKLYGYHNGNFDYDTNVYYSGEDSWLLLTDVFVENK